MKNIVLVFVVAGFISACVITSINELPIRSPQQFLNDVKVVADAGCLENVEFVSRWLRVDYRRGVEEPVYDGSGKFIEGYGVDVTRHTSSKEYLQEGRFYYRIYQSKGRDFYRVGISLPINSGVICATPYDFLDVFGDVERYSVAHGTRWGYVRDNRSVKTRVVFSVGDDGCLSGIGISKNRAWR
ncbi:hypothetical protein [Burkholderia ubonensis]|uniref:hypothetical protein n=1 Tax=Burkholderia ubonensis TaxID=101571 RepID=UPI0012F9803F|nr:hypothetical protein [Burkholderia ubonensis]